jgi:hypothetical protein
MGSVSFHLKVPVKAAEGGSDDNQRVQAWKKKKSRLQVSEV